MSRQSSLRVVLVVLITAMVVTAVPAQVGAASAKLVVGSQHTDFGTGDESSPQTLDNLTVEGSGDSAGVALADVQTTIYSVVSDSGDGTAESERTLLGDGGNNEKIHTELKTVPNTTGSIKNVTAHVSGTSGSDYGVAVDIYAVKEDPDGTVGEGTLVKENWDPNWATGAQTIQLDTEVAVQKGETVTFEFVVSGSDGDGSNDQLRIGTDEDSGLTAWYWNPVSGFVDGGANLDVGIGSKTDSSATYLSATHNVSNGEEAAINITQASNVSINATIRTDSGTVLNQTELTSTGNHTLLLADTSSDKLETVLNVSVTGDNPQFELGDESILFDNDAPVVDNSSASPSGGEKLTTKGVTLSIDVNDSQFGTAQGESLTVDFQTKAPDESSFSTAATTTLNSNGTASTSLSGLVGGTHEWRVVVTDDYGAQTTSQTFEFQVPDKLFIRNVSNTSEKISSTAEVTFYGESTIVENSTNDGEINLTGLPVGETMVVEVSASNYHTRTTIIESIYQQQTIYMLNTSVASVEVRFELEDNTGNFDSDSTYILVERPLTESGETNWVTVTGDYFGVNGFTTDLEDGQKYRLRVKNAAGDERVLGTFTATASETVTLTIGEVTSVPEGCNCSVTHNASYDDSGSKTYVRFDYNDTEVNTSELHVKIYEKDNESNVLFPNTTYTDLGTVAVVEEVPTAENDTTWAVDVVGKRNGEQFTFKTYVGPRDPVLPTLPGWVRALISIGSIWIVAGLFSQLNGEVGAVATAGLGGMWWFVDFLPQETGIGVVILALVTAGILMVQSQRGGT